MTNFQGTQPKEIFYIPNHFALWKIPAFFISSNLSWNRNFCRSLHMPFFFQPQQTYRKLQTPGDHECSNNMKLQMFGHQAMHLRFCQSSGHGSFSSRRAQPRRPLRLMEKWTPGLTLMWDASKPHPGRRCPTGFFHFSSASVKIILLLDVTNFGAETGLRNNRYYDLCSEPQKGWLLFFVPPIPSRPRKEPSRDESSSP